MVDKEIIKALERLKNTKNHLKEQYREQVKKCPYPELKPIAKQTYEDNKKAFDIAIKAIEEFNRLQAEIEELENGIEEINCKLDMANDCIPEQRAEAIKEFAERLKEMASKTFWETDAYVGTEQIDNLVKEMVGDDK